MRAVWIELERPDRPKGRTETRLLISTNPMMPALDGVRAYAKRWSVQHAGTGGKPPCVPGTD